MIASRSEPTGLGATIAIAIAIALGQVACSSARGVPVAPAVEPLPQPRAIVPDDADLAARDLAAAALVGDQPGVARHLSRLHALDEEQRGSLGSPTGLVPVATDLASAARDDHEAYIANAEALLDRDDLDPATRTRLEQTVNDEPLRLAAARRRDARVTALAGVVNRLAEPIGRAALSGVTALAGLGRALLSFAIEKHLEDELGVHERQALVQEKRFLAQSPDAPGATEVAEQVEADEVRLAQTHRDRALRTARRALDSGNARVALVATERALRFVPEDAEATELRDRAAEQLAHERSERERAVDVAAGAPGEVAPPDARTLAVALLAPNGDVAGEARRLLDREPDGDLADEALFARAIALGEAGHETEMWEALADLSDGEDDPDGPNMARHAGLLVTSPDSNPYGAFLAARSKQRGAKASWVLFGPLASGARDRDLPRPVEWLIEVPTLVDIVTSLPARIVRYPWMDKNTFGRTPSQHARAYLKRNPDGEYAPAMREYLLGEEIDDGAHMRAYELARASEAIDPETLAELREKAAAQLLEIARAEKRRDMRIMLARQAAQDFPDTAAGHEAGNFVREEVGRATPQQVRLTRNFLLENPRVAGTDGLGLQPIVMDGDLRNGELHPEGVVLAGGLLLELRFVAKGKSEDDPPALQRKQISAERLSRVVALLEETAIRNELIDSDNDQAFDAQRDLFFEAAKLGVAENADLRPSAESSYVFEGLRDRYGLVRGRESILPVDLVLQGSLPSLGLGAFPRIRTPKPTPDAILYK